MSRRAVYDALENTIVFVANLFLVVIILSRMYHAAGTTTNVCADPSIFLPTLIRPCVQPFYCGSGGCCDS